MKKKENISITKDLIKYGDSWNESQQNLNSVFNKIIVPDISSEDTFSLKCYQLLKLKQEDLISKNKANLETIYLESIKPMLEFIRNYRNTSDNRINLLLPALIASEMFYSHHEKLKDNRIKHLNYSKEHLLELKKLLNESINNLKNKDWIY